MVMAVITDLGGDNVNVSSDSNDNMIALFVIVVILVIMTHGIHLNIYQNSASQLFLQGLPDGCAPLLESYAPSSIASCHLHGCAPLLEKYCIRGRWGEGRSLLNFVFDVTKKCI